MGLFNKLFRDNSKPDNPDNTRLLELIDIAWKESDNGNNSKNVLLELMNGNSFLMFPTKNNYKVFDTDKWNKADKDTSIKMASLVDIDGLKILGVFTDEQSLLNWTKKPSEYTAMRSQDVLKFAQENGIERIVINTNQPNMFVVERNKTNVKEHIIMQDTKILLGEPDNPLSNYIIQKLIDNFKEDKTISEVYQYGQTKDGEFSIVLGFVLTTYSDNAKTAAINKVQNALQNQKIVVPLDLFFIETEEWHERIKKIEKALIYKK